MRSIGIRKAPETYDTTVLGRTDHVPQGVFFKKLQKFLKTASQISTLQRYKGRSDLCHVVAADLCGQRERSVPPIELTVDFTIDASAASNSLNPNEIYRCYVLARNVGGDWKFVNGGQG